ncbi:MAG: putative sulfate exporter family transporter [Pseudomonadales bacterium]|jgi:uncharacterized integral membrane protein (TIGR00698 family)|nr:putative sulfate exporter family transporter [Gammaproteobacteria bacterium]MDG1305113.1 putative sulfate exporter family transporter [Pseudomonadales bacterium]MDG1908988.1 putative sulfate exporter family transporter [Pseudomonadales bacterium]|tara:strand:- start:155 stop:1081 length:927 start_codon:yes stop_codon:yes gene_type:complete
MNPAIGLTFYTLILLPLIYFGNPAVALLVGMAITLGLNKTLISNASVLGKYSLQAAIILLGLKLNIGDLWRISANYTLAIFIYVIAAITIGLMIGRLMKVERNSSLLMASGTAICGGTTIATLSPIIKARPDQTGVALAIVFLLNAVALFTFPHVGHWLEMTQEQFGVWVALAIHDTSSVVATAQIYGEESAAVATTLKLGRTLWLIPLVLIVSFRERSEGAKVRLPGFILLFLLASVAGSTLPMPEFIPSTAAALSKALLVIALFFIGTEISRSTLGNLKGKVLVQALALWGIVVPATLFMVIRFVD